MSKLDELAAKITDGQDVFAELESEFSLKEVSGVICQLLQRNDEGYFHATTLLRDLILKPQEESNSFGQAFRESYLSGGQQAIVDRLESDVRRSNVQVRPWAIYALGKIGSKSSLPVLWESLDVALQRIPDIVVCLASEIRWLEESEDEQRRVLDLLASSDSYLNRWATIDVVESSVNGEKEVVDKLREDEHPYVRRAASLVGKEGRSRAKFAWVVAAFRPTQSVGEYSVATFEAFVDAYMAKHEPRTHKEVRKLQGGQK